ncbi:CO6A3-like protein [Mya arenaria]|uniref:CO6A3-like protein n=1 Tax=Mya arenaria TaxID=6604 RepID=A0ABY7F952_MYAAR|nr:CO6A3-like protein [Mya arenaria]
MTDGQSTSPTLTAQQARVLHFSNIKVISIGIGSGVVKTELGSIASDAQHVFTVPCAQKQADVVFVLDTSGSEGSVNFKKQLQFVANVTNSFDIGPSNTQVSVVTFGTHAYNEFFLNTYGDRPSLQTAINNITYRGGTTNTAEALNFVSTNSKFERFQVISVGIGVHVSQTELTHIANDPQHVLNVADFNSLDSITTEIETVACTTPSPCGDHPADIVFLLDSSSSEGAANFQMQLDFMTDFVRQFDIGPSDVQVGLTTFSSSAHNEFYFNAILSPHSHRDKTSLIAAIQSVRFRGGTTATDQALRNARYYQFASYHGARPNATRIVIVLTDGQSTDTGATIAEARSLKTQSHATVIAIGIGSNVNQFELNNVATDRNHVFTVGSFSILHTLQVELKDQSCGSCGKEPADIVFVLDSSASEGSINFQKQLDFVRDFVYQFNIGPSQVMVSVVTFSSSVHEQFPLNRYTNQKDLLAGIARITYNSGVTYTDKALQYVRLHSFLASKGARANATDLVILLTDGQSTHPTDTAREADLLKNRTNVKVVAIGIGSGVHTTELQRIASDDSHALAVVNFDSLNTIKSELTYVTCQTCGFVSKADIVFILDASSSEGSLNFHSQLDFVSRVVNDFQVGPHNVQIGVLTFSDQPHIAFKLNQHTSKNTVLDAIQRVPYIQGLTNTHQALQYARTTMFTSAGGARSDAQHYAVVLTDGASSNSAQTLQQATLLKQQHVTVIAIGIGGNINKNELSNIASDSNHVFTVSDFNALRTLHFDVSVQFYSELSAAYSPDCFHDKADIVFLLDSSYREGEPNFRKQLAFVSNFTTPYDIGPDKVQVSVVTFSTSPHNAFYLNTYRDRASLLNGINNVRYTSGSTSTDKALEFVRSTSFSPLHGARLGVPKILVVMTDGQSTSPTLTAQQAHILHFSDIKVISIGIGSGVVKTELASIATNAQHVFTVPSFDSLQTIQTEIRSAACTCVEKCTSCTQKTADVVFVLDTSGREGGVNFDKQLQFVANVTNSFDIGPSNIQVSVVTFGTHAYNEFFLNDYGDRPSLQTAINNITYRGGTTNTAEALNFVSTNSFKAENGGRCGAVVRLVVVLTDGNSNSAYSTQTAANHLHALGVRVISVGIGAHVSQTELIHIANDPQHVLNVADFNSLNSITTEMKLSHLLSTTSKRINVMNSHILTTHKHKTNSLTTGTTPSPCGDHPADIVFLLDSSSSEGADNFQKQLDFMTNFVRQFDIGPSDVQVGLVTFSSSAHSEFYLNSYVYMYIQRCSSYNG